MAKQYLKDLINMDYETLINLAKKENINQFKSVLTTMINSANRRIRTLKKSPIGEFSPAYKKLKDAGIDVFKKEITYKADKIKKQKSKTISLDKATSKDTGKMLEMYSNLKQFLSAKTSKLQGWQKARSEVKKRVGAKQMFQREYKSKRSASYWINKEKKFWRLYNKLVDEFGGVISQLDSDRIQTMLYKIQTMRIKGKTDVMIQQVMEDYITKLNNAKNKNLKVDDADFIKQVEEEFVIPYGK